MFRFLDGITDRIFGLTGAVLLSQFPLFINEYIQRLSGHVAELEKQLNALRTLASGESLDVYIAKFLTQTDPDFRSQGLFMQNMVDRYEHLQASLFSLKTSSEMSLPYVFLNHLHYSIIEGTWKNFTPGMLFNLEGLIYAVLGMFLGSALYSFIKKVIEFFLYLVSFKKFKYIL